MWSPHTPGSLVLPRALQSVSLRGGAPLFSRPSTRTERNGFTQRRATGRRLQDRELESWSASVVLRGDHRGSARTVFETPRGPRPHSRGLEPPLFIWSLHMKSGMTLQNLAVEIDRVRRTKCDYLIPSSSLTMRTYPDSPGNVPTLSFDAPNGLQHMPRASAKPSLVTSRLTFFSRGRK